MGAYTRDDADGVRADLERVVTLFPFSASGAVTRAGRCPAATANARHGRALLARPRLLVIDEPSMGLSPLYVDRIFDIVQGLDRDGIGVLLVEQNADIALSIAARGYVLQSGRIVLHDTAQNLVNDPMMRKAYLEL